MGDLPFMLDSIIWNSGGSKLSKKQMKDEYELFGPGAASGAGGGMVFENFSERLKYENLHCPEAMWDEILDSEKPQVYMEELRRQNQLELESSLLRETAKRLGVYDSCPSLWATKSNYYDSDYDSLGYEYDDDEDEPVTTTTPPVTPKNKLQLSRSRNKLRLYNVSIHPCRVTGRRGKTVSGTLEAHANGFRYKNYNVPFELDIMFHNVSYAFFQDGDEKMAPLCHLHLHNPIMVGTEMTKDIQFRMVQTSKGSRNMRSLVGGSDEFKNEHQKGKDDSEQIRIFLSEVDPILRRSNLFRFAEVEKKHGFYGEMILKEHLTLPPAIFVFTFNCLVQLEHLPFTVVILSEVEIVHLVPAGSEMEMLNMTIVFKDFKRDVLQIGSIPSKELISIKMSLDMADVKYYESQDRQNQMDIRLWRCVLNKITNNPKKFINMGGWKFLNSENGKLFNQNPDSSDVESGHSRNINMPLSVTKRTMSVGKRVMLSSDESECDSRPIVSQKHTSQRNLVKTARRKMVMVMSDDSDSEAESDTEAEAALVNTLLGKIVK